MTATRAHVRCPSCQAELRADQDWCLECGAAATTRIAPPPRLGVAAGLAALVAAAVIAAIAIGVTQLSAGNGTPGPHRAVAAQHAARPTPAPASPAHHGAPARAMGHGARGGRAASVPERSGAARGRTTKLATWPSSRTAYTVMILSTTDEKAGRRAARKLARAGLAVGYLHSDDFSSLSSGHWSIWTGHYPTESAARRAARRLATQGHPGVVPALLKPR